ncbi:endogenous retrovirus group K member 5 Gag polyprotein-like [Dasypus novemcinctus]|uniref:endogenous retrovirus group K member 5 Gag polyprotein-like n=1 Tax=Dasypus novemcinctus TaxID=9361 RepID=UPI00265FAFBE|nr:endogenous retrovirus group K member 5 Gag polyprotein-like [Dasypus novemcinctus]
MGGRLSSRQSPQVRALAGLLDTNQIRVSLRQLQKYWDLLLPFNPWLSTCHLWDPVTYTRLIDRVTSAMEHEGKRFPPGLLPTLIAIRSCLQGAPAPQEAFPCHTTGEGCSSDQVTSDPDSDTESLSARVNAALEEEPPKREGCHKDDCCPGDHPTKKKDGKLPPSSPPPEGCPAQPAFAGAGNLYPPLPRLSPSWGPPEMRQPPSWGPPEVPQLPFWGLPEGGLAPSWGHAEAAEARQSTSWDSPKVGPSPAPASAGEGMSPWRRLTSPPPSYPSAPTPHLYPLNANPSQQRPQDWYPFSSEEIKTLQRAVKEDGLGSPYAQQLLEELGTQLAVPYDWVSLGRSILTPGQFIDWRAHFQIEAEKQIAENARMSVRDPPEAYTGTGPFSNPQRYRNALPAFWLRLRALALRSFCNSSATQLQKFAQLTQGRDEKFSTLLSRVMEACQQKVVGEQAQLALARDLILEEANAVCKPVIQNMREKGVHDWVLAGKAIDPQATAVAKALATALVISSDCFKCSEMGHFARECPHARGLPRSPQRAEGAAPPPAPQARRGPPTPCPRCGKGYHWAQDCHSRPSQRLPLNSKGGKPQPRHQEAPAQRAPLP